MSRVTIQPYSIGGGKLLLRIAYYKNLFPHFLLSDIAHLVTSYLYPDINRQVDSVKRGLVEDSRSFEDSSATRRAWGRGFTGDQAQDVKVLNELNKILDDYSIERRGKNEGC